MTTGRDSDQTLGRTVPELTRKQIEDHLKVIGYINLQDMTYGIDLRADLRGPI
jgi:hypothetical protein